MRFSQAISEGDGISLIVDVADVEAARAAGADAWVVPAEHAVEHTEDFGLDRVVRVCNEDELALALERLDPEIFLLSVGDDDADALRRALDLLPDVPAGKLAVAE